MHTQLPIFKDPLSYTNTWINAQCLLSDIEGVRVVFFRGVPVYRYALDDRVTERFVVVSLVDDGLVKQIDAAKAFGISVPAIRLWQSKYEHNGITGLTRKKRVSHLLKMGGVKDRAVSQMFYKGISNCEMGRRLGVSESAIRTTLNRLGLKRAKNAEQLELPDTTDHHANDCPDKENQASAKQDTANDAKQSTDSPVVDLEHMHSEERGDDIQRNEIELQAPLAQQIESELTESGPSDADTDHQAEVASDKENQASAKLDNEEETKQSTDSPILGLEYEHSEERGDDVQEKDVERQVPLTQQEESEQSGSGPSDADDDAPIESLDTDPHNRVVDRLLAKLGKISDAAPVFMPERRLVYAGVLLAVPLIVSNGVLSVFRAVYQSLGPGFYGLRTVVMSLLFMALVRIKRPENLKEVSPRGLGHVLGLDRAPEVKTIRRKLKKMERKRKGAELMRQLAKKRLDRRRNVLGYLYLDGHVREYHGKGKLGKTHVARRRIAAPGATDTWVNDAAGEPLFVVTSDLNEGLTKKLEPIVDEVEKIVGKGRRFTVVFDRGGWSPKLFARLVERGVDVLTYRKGKIELLSEDSFEEKTAEVEGKEIRYKLHQMSMRMGKTTTNQEDGNKRPLWMRQVSRLCEKGGHQTQVMTTRQDLDACEVLWRMFSRWRQENFFKYMRHEYAIDGLVDYNLEQIDKEHDRPNPKRKAVEKRLRKAKEELERLEALYGAAAIDNPENKRPTMRGFKIANGKMGKELKKARCRVEDLKRQRDELDKRVPADDLEKLSTERKLITDAIKMTAYQIECDLVRLIQKDYVRTEKDGHKLIVSALKSSADIEISGDELQVTIAAQSSPHRTRIIASLCKKLTAMQVCFPGTKLRLRYAVETP